MSNIPDWLIKLAGTTKYLPLEARQKMLPGIVNKLHKSGLLSQLTGDELSQPAVFMAHFLGGSGEPLELDVSDKEWKALIKKADEPMKTNIVREGIDTRRTNVWTPSTNPKYHGDQGWEWKQINVGEIDEFGYGALYNILGYETTLRRRKVGKDKYEYQIAEDFDVHEGIGGRDYSAGSAARSVPPSVAKLIETVFPEYTADRSERMDGESTSSKGWISATKQLKGVPVPIKASYIHSTKTEDMLIDSMIERVGVF